MGPDCLLLLDDTLSTLIRSTVLRAKYVLMGRGGAIALVGLGCVQEAMKRAFYERNHGRGLYATFAWLVEEVGELAEALIKGDRERVEEELADVVAWTLSIANLLDIDVGAALWKKYGRELEAAGCATS
jgi:NTP pyrophosphatase (non-canonical NTP hydrolase)